MLSHVDIRFIVSYKQILEWNLNQPSYKSLSDLAYNRYPRQNVT